MKHEKNKQGGALQKDQKRQKQDKALTCFHCRKLGHFKKDFTKYHAWRENKGDFVTLVCKEVNLASVPTDNWWLDFGATIQLVCQCRVTSICRSQVVRRNMCSLAMTLQLE